MINEKLVQMYVEGMEEKYLTHFGSWLNPPPVCFYEPLFAEEVKIGGEEEEFQRKETKEWEKARQLLKEKNLGL